VNSCELACELLSAKLFLRGEKAHKNTQSKIRKVGKCAVFNLTELLGKDRPLKEIWVPYLKQYQIERTNKGAAADTVNRELSTLSRIFGVMIELQLVDSNPVPLVKRLSTRSEERQVYLSFEDAQKIADKCPAWFQPIILTDYCTGMRRGEILGLDPKTNEPCKEDHNLVN
jgi:integrase